MGPGTEDAMHLMYFTEQPMSAYPSDIGLATGHTALMFSNKYFDPVAGSRLYNEYLEHYMLCRGNGYRRLHAERAPQRAVLHAGQVQHLCRDARRGDERGEDHPAGQPTAIGRQPGATRRGIVDDRHDLQGPP